MKNLFIYLIIIVQFSALSQTEKKDFNFKKIYDIKMSKEQLKENTNAWMVKTFTNTNNGIKLTSGDNLIARGKFDGVFRDGLGGKRPCHFEYLIEVSFKENKYRLTLSQYTIHPKNNFSIMLANWSMLYHKSNPEDFIKQQKEFYTNSNYIGSKTMLNRLNKPKKIAKDIKRHKKYFDVVHPQILAKQKLISESLFNYLEKKKESDW